MIINKEDMAEIVESVIRRVKIQAEKQPQRPPQRPYERPSERPPERLYQRPSDKPIPITPELHLQIQETFVHLKTTFLEELNEVHGHVTKMLKFTEKNNPKSTADSYRLKRLLSELKPMLDELSTVTSDMAKELEQLENPQKST